MKKVMGIEFDEGDIARFHRHWFPCPLEECWLWLAAKSKATEAINYYGKFWVKGKTVRAHKFAFITHVGAYPKGWHLDHKCHYTLCVNPAHLIPILPGLHNRYHIIRDMVSGVRVRAADGT
ncbi:MAG: HNH endonuclease, partial [Anaerolineae bacterium]|nr:HNH endonuclease [Anaerolineae bacterium]